MRFAYVIRTKHDASLKIMLAGRAEEFDSETEKIKRATMNPYLKPKAQIALIFCILTFLGCTKSIEIRMQSPAGTFSGQTPGGDPVIITVDQIDEGISGSGTINGDPIVISGVRTWNAIGTLTDADGSAALVRIELSSDNDSLTITKTGQADIVLVRGGAPVYGASGPFTGKYRSVAPNDSFAQVTIVQTGALISGIAKIFDQITAISGRLTDTRKAQGTVTYSDESRVMFHAELSADANSITITGMGDPIELERF